MTILSEMPLLGKTVVVTRAQEQQGEARKLLISLGAKVLDLPALIIGPPDDLAPLDNALLEIDTFDWLVFSSGNGVNAVFERLKNLKKNFSAEVFTKLKIAAVGRKTARQLKSFGVIANYVPPDFVAESLIKNFPDSGQKSKLLLPRVQTGGRPFLSKAFHRKGFEVIEVAAYDSCCPESMPEETIIAFENAKVDAITFSSGKTVVHTAKLMSKYFGSTWLDQFENVKLISIGPQTSLSCKKYLKRLDDEANPHDLEGLVQSCINIFSTGSL